MLVHVPSHATLFAHELEPDAYHPPDVNAGDHNRDTDEPSFSRMYLLDGLLSNKIWSKHKSAGVARTLDLQHHLIVRYFAPRLYLTEGLQFVGCRVVMLQPEESNVMKDSPTPTWSYVTRSMIGLDLSCPPLAL